MNNYESTYDFYELVNTTNMLNHVFTTEYRKNGLAFNKQHNKMQNVWKLLQKLQLGEELCNLGNYNKILTNVDVTAMLHKGLKGT